MSESIVQRKLAKLIQQELGELLRLEFPLQNGAFSTIRMVRVSGDLGLAKIYVTVLPDSKLAEVAEAYNEHAWQIRKSLAARIRNKVRKIPEVRFFGDDSYQVAERIDEILEDVEIPEEE
ncbi:MAG: 30S ribosome-binding factor RbfA [Bacteroidota bacterium]